jgi:hypothetical protein
MLKHKLPIEDSLVKKTAKQMMRKNSTKKRREGKKRKLN